MKTLTPLLQKNLQVVLVLISITLMACAAFGVEPIGAIGQPNPEQHAFLTNDTILRVVPTHIQVVDTDTGAVIDEFGDREWFYYVAFSPNRSHVVIQTNSDNSKGSIVSIWDVNTRERISEWEIESYIDIAAFSPTQPLLAISFADEIYLWNWQTGERIGKMIGTRRQFEQCYRYISADGSSRGGSCPGQPSTRDMVFTPDGKHLIVTSQRPDIEVWDVERRRLVGHFEGHTGTWVDGVAISPDGANIATFERSPASVYVWDMTSRQLLWTARSGIGEISEVAFSPDSQNLYVATKTGAQWRNSRDGPWEGSDDKVRTWDVKTGEQIDTFGAEFQDLLTITLSPDGKKALLYYRDAAVLWDIAEKQPTFVWADFVGEWWFREVALSPDGKTFAAVSSHFIKTWDVDSQQMRLFTSAEGHKFLNLAISPDSQKIAVSKEFESSVELRNLQTGEIETRLRHSILSWRVEEIVFGTSGRWLAVSDNWAEDELAILDVKNPENPQKLHLEPKLGAELELAADEFAFSENDEYFAASGATGNNNQRKYWIMLWKREVDTFVFQHAWQTTRIYSPPAFTTTVDGATVLAVEDASGIQIWKLSLDRPELLTTVNAEGRVQFSPDGRYLFANQGDHFQIWDWQRNRPINHASFPEFSFLSQDGSVLLSYDITGQYQIWDIRNVLSLLPYSVEVEPKGKQLVTLGEIKRNQLLQNFPNPFNPETWIPFRLANESLVTIRIYTPAGKLVRTLAPGRRSAGEHASPEKAIHWDGRNNAGEQVSSGVYLYTINAGDFSDTRKMLIRK